MISHSEVERLQSSKYRGTTVIPYVEKPRMNIRILDQEGLETLLEGYSEYAEFVISIERFDHQGQSRA